MALRNRFRVSERLACPVVGQHRNSQRHPGNVVSIEAAKLRKWLRQTTADHIRQGRRIAERLLLREGWTANYKQ